MSILNIKSAERHRRAYKHTHTLKSCSVLQEIVLQVLKLKDQFQNAGARVARFGLDVEMPLQVTKINVFFSSLEIQP